MNKTNLSAVTATLMLLGLSLSGCSTAPQGAASAAPKNQGVAAASTSVGGAQLWGERCGFCHNVRSPTSYSDAQWEVATLHMRVRANLTGNEQRKILEFLKSAN